MSNLYDTSRWKTLANLPALAVAMLSGVMCSECSEKSSERVMPHYTRVSLSV
jgi:hypothetical protein